MNNSVNLLPSDLGATNCNFGKSQFPADAYFNGRFSQATLNSSAEPVAAILAPAAAIIQPVTNTLFTGGETVDFVATGSPWRRDRICGPPNFIPTGWFIPHSGH